MSRSSILALVVGALLLAAIGSAGWFLAPSKPRPGIVETRVGAVRLRLDARLLRTDETRARRDDTLDLLALLPDFTPPPEGATKARNEDLVFLTLRPQEPTIDPAERPARLYVRFLEPSVWSHAGGLSMRRFEAGSPYEREELYFTPPEGRSFAARCIRPVQPPDGLPNTCITDLRVHGLDVQVRFSPEQLANWSALVSGAHRLIEGMAR